MTIPISENTQVKLPRSFILRRLHSLLGLWLVIYLGEHLLVNSQAAFFFQDDGYGFVTAVNKLEALPYLRVIEAIFLGIPFIIHGIWGILYAITSKHNAHPTDGTQPSLPQYKRNRAFSWQRITSWLLIPAILFHVIHMRFWGYPAHYVHGDAQHYMVKVARDRGLALVADKLSVKLYTSADIQQRKEFLQKKENKLSQLKKEDSEYFSLLDQIMDDRAWLHAAETKSLGNKEVLAATPSAGAAFYLLLRETFKSPLMVVFYSLFVVAATFHAFNGLWTFMITWGITLTQISQRRMRTIANFFMAIVTLLGLMAAWGTYWTFQFQG